MTIQVVTNLPLTPKHRLRFSTHLNGHPVHLPEVSLVANGLEVCVWDEENLAVGGDYRIGKLPPHLPRLARAMGVMSGKSE